jgi:riboflavin kinase, archaea type
MEPVEPGGQPASIVLRGLLVDGLGEGGRFTALEWVRQRFRDLLAIDPYPGTVNVRLASEEQRAALARLRASRGIPLPPEQGFCAATCYRATIVGPAGSPHIPAAIVVPDVPGYPLDQVELVAARHVRNALGVRPGDQLTIRVAL